TLGSVVNGAITQAGQTNYYTFTLADPSHGYFDSLANDSNLRWTLTGPRGIEASNKAFSQTDGAYSGSSPTLIAGTYTLAVSGSADHTGSYSFRISDLATTTAITPGTAVSGTLNPGNSTNLYRFNANAGDRYYFDWQAASGGTEYWRLINPYGNQIW